MRKLFGLIFIALLSTSVFASQDATDNKFDGLIKQGIKDRMDSIWIIDFKDNILYSYHYFKDIDLTEKNIENVIQKMSDKAMLENCTVSKEEMYKVAHSSDSLTFSCILSMKEMFKSQNLNLSEEQLSKVKDKEIKMIIVGLNSKESGFIKGNEPSSMSLAFNNSTFQGKEIYPITDLEPTITIMKEKCNITKNGIYDNCLNLSSRIIVIGL